MRSMNSGTRGGWLRGSAVAVALGLTTLAAANLKIVTTTADLGSIAKAIGGNSVSVFTIVTGARDPHRIEAKPSYMSRLAGADMFVVVGLELEVGYEQPLLEGSRNPRIQRGARGYVEASDWAYVLEKPAGHVSRSHGDVHPSGNPHIWLDPYNGRQIAIGLAAKMGQLDPPKKEEYRQGMVRFVNRLDAEMFGDALFKKYGGPKLWDWQRAGQLRQKLQADGTLGQLGGWAGLMLPMEGTPIITYHRTWSYFARRFGLNVVDELEPKPGLEPTPGHLMQIVQLVRNRGIKIVLQEPYYSRKHADFVARRAGATAVILPNNVGQTTAAKDYFSLFDTIVSGLRAASR